jgi:hypothetical protein
MTDFAHITQALDLGEADIKAAMASRETARTLLAHLAARSAPNTGAAKVLLVLARMATTACDWLDGDLAIDLRADGEATRVEVATELGGGLRERVFPTLVLKAPLVEFGRAIERVPHMIAPLAMGGRSASRITLGATAAIRKTSIPPPPIEIAPESLFVHLPAPGLPRDTGGASPVPLPVVTSGLPVVGGAECTERTERTEPVQSDAPPKDVDSGWDD